MTTGMTLIRATTSMVIILLCSLPLEVRGDATMPDCSVELLELSPCLSFVSDQVPNPPQTCCDALETVVMKTPLCLCELVARGKNGTANTGLPAVNLTLVRQLPKDCRIQSEIQQGETRCLGAGHGAPAPSPYTPPGSACSPLLVPPVFSLLVWAITTTIAPVLVRQLCSLPPLSILNANELHDRT